MTTDYKVQNTLIRHITTRGFKCASDLSKTGHTICLWDFMLCCCCWRHEHHINALTDKTHDCKDVCSVLLARCVWCFVRVLCIQHILRVGKTLGACRRSCSCCFINNSCTLRNMCPLLSRREHLPHQTHNTWSFERKEYAMKRVDGPFMTFGPIVQRTIGARHTFLIIENACENVRQAIGMESATPLCFVLPTTAFAAS